MKTVFGFNSLKKTVPQPEEPASKDFSLGNAQIRAIAKAQMTIDKDFAKKVIELRRKLFTKQISALQFWEEYKQALVKTTQKNQEKIEELINKNDSKIKEMCKKSDQKPTHYPDLNLPK